LSRSARPLTLYHRLFDKTISYPYKTLSTVLRTYK